MFCARCGEEVGAEAKACPGCDADLWGSGALRLTSPIDPPQRFADVFPEFPDPRRGEPDDPGGCRVLAGHRTRLLIGLAVLAVVGSLLGWTYFRLVHRHFDHPAVVAAPSLSVRSAATPTPGPAASTGSPSATPSPTAVPTPQLPSATPTRDVTGIMPSSAKSCSPIVGTSPGTSCGLALVVAEKVPTVPAGRFDVVATSPVSGGTYTMHCTAAAMTVCIGGRAVVVYVLK